MITRLASLRQDVHALISRSVWFARLLRLPVSEGPADRPGLILIQIDGLSHQEFDVALSRNELPFIQHLINAEHYQFHSFYSGLPASTPAVQAELFYGVKCAVPAFSFRDAATGKIVRMLEHEAAVQVQDTLDKNGKHALLKDGSAYVDIFTGGATEAHYCSSALGWGPALRSANPIIVVLFLASNFYSCVRTGVLLLLEFIIAVSDFFRGMTTGFDFVKELKFIPTRVGICIVLRELAVIGAKIDISRGLPVIHINFLGYDEQAHRRGPKSLFAHWSLKGIDDAIKRIYTATARSKWRDYQVWIYSDHGQATVTPYHKQQGYTLKQAVTEVFKEHCGGRSPAMQLGPSGVQTQRVRYLGGQRFQRLFSVLNHYANGAQDMNSKGGNTPELAVASLGSVGFIYPAQELSAEQCDNIASDLAVYHGVPLVIIKHESASLRAWTNRGLVHLPAQIDEMLGQNHPFLREAGQDLLDLCRHGNAGQFILLGWRDGIAPVSFAFENGAHTGASVEETSAVCLLPENVVLTKSALYLRPLDLRRAALHYLGHQQDEQPATDLDLVTET